MNHPTIDDRNTVLTIEDIAALRENLHEQRLFRREQLKPRPTTYPKGSYLKGSRPKGSHRRHSRPKDSNRKHSRPNGWAPPTSRYASNSPPPPAWS